MIVWCLNDQLSAMASCLEKNFRTFFNFGYFFCGLQATVSDFGQKTSYCQIRLKKLHSPTKHTLRKSSLQWHHAWKKIQGLFSILVTFFAVCKQLWAILFKRLVIAKLGWKNYIPQLNTWKKFKIFKNFFS